jgi:hypothetical protein
MQSIYSLAQRRRLCYDGAIIPASAIEERPLAKEQYMAQQQRRLSRRDEVYLSSPGFEPYMGSGAVFVAIFTAVFIVSIKIGFAWLVWPGLLLAVLGGYGVLVWLQRREYAHKLAEIEANPSPPDTTP